MIILQIFSHIPSYLFQNCEWGLQSGAFLAGKSICEVSAAVSYKTAAISDVSRYPQIARNQRKKFP